MLLMCRGYVERVCPRSLLIKHVAQRRHLNANPCLDSNYLSVRYLFGFFVHTQYADFQKLTTCDKRALTLRFTTLCRVYL